MPLASPTPIGIDLLRWPVIGPFLRWRHARTSLQLVLLLAAAVVVLHGLVGPDIAPSNLATVATWVHYRGLLVVALLGVGNLFCTGCPFVFVRDVGRRLHPPRRRWPRVLRTKWIGIALLVAVLFTYELFDLWALPRTTAYLVLSYFVAALTVDLVFAGATFCKYLCPIGQFNFVASTLSPLEVRVREPETCRTCHTSDCIKGRRQDGRRDHIVRRGCELGLFLPLKVGNLDCTLCLDCVHACPHDNVALASRVPGVELLEERRRSGIGRLAQRSDIAVLVVLFAFGGMLNSFAMVPPVYDLERWLARQLGTTSEAAVLAFLFLLALGVLPLMALAAATFVTRRLARDRTGSIRETAMRYTYSLIPFGFGVWLAHYGFHLLTGALTIVPVTQSALLSALGWPALGEPLWRWTGMQPGAVFPIQVGFILLGTLGSLALAYRISERDYPLRAGSATVPWAILVVVLASVGMWVLSQPMEMRGMGFAG